MKATLSGDLRAVGNAFEIEGLASAAPWGPRWRALTGSSRLPMLRRHERPSRRHLLGNYPLAIHAGCGRLFSSPEMFGRPANEAAGRLVFVVRADPIETWSME